MHAVITVELIHSPLFVDPAWHFLISISDAPGDVPVYILL